MKVINVEQMLLKYAQIRLKVVHLTSILYTV